MCIVVCVRACVCACVCLRVLAHGGTRQKRGRVCWSCSADSLILARSIGGRKPPLKCTTHTHTHKHAHIPDTLASLCLILLVRSLYRYTYVSMMFVGVATYIYTMYPVQDPKNPPK